ncbi:hypothetical protein TDB9533_02520 [Thalassocella blandensis]|nr:hypothetical protein TDB9533_02520 [Thalassocella blandensis]
MNDKLFFNGNIIDVEASGFSSDSYPVEIGIMLGSGASFEAIIKPTEDWTHWCEEAQGIHGLSRAFLHEFGQDVRVLCEHLNDFCEDQTLYSDAWVWDSFWINRLYAAAGMRPSFTCSPLEYFLSEQHVDEWLDYKRLYAKQLKLPQHRALNDAKIIANILSDEGIIQPMDLGIMPVEFNTGHTEILKSA